MGGNRSVAVSLVLAVCAAGLLVVPLLLLQGFFTSVPVFGASGDSSRYFVKAAVLGLGLPFVGLIVASIARRTGWAWFFGVVLVLALAVAGLNRVDDVRHAPIPPREPTHCVERSGGGNECPGG